MGGAAMGGMGGAAVVDLIFLCTWVDIFIQPDGYFYAYEVRVISCLSGTASRGNIMQISVGRVMLSAFSRSRPLH
jgi:hypothetical protein